MFPPTPFNTVFVKMSYLFVKSTEFGIHAVLTITAKPCDNCKKDKLMDYDLY